MAAEVAPNSFINSEGLKDNSSSKDDECQDNQGLISSEEERIERVTDLGLKDEQSDRILKGNGNSGLVMNPDVSHKIQAELPTSQSTVENLECSKPIIDKQSSSDVQREESGVPRPIQDRSLIGQREQSASVDSERTPIDTGKPETDFLEDMRVFEADAAASGQARGM